MHVARVVISGYYGFGNAGDEAVLAGIVASLRERCSAEIEIIAHSIDPAATSKIHSVQTVHRYRPADVVKTIRGADLVISGGGSLLQDVTSAKSILYYLGIIRLARLFRRPVMIYAQGIGPIKGRLNRLLTRMELNGASAITVRDDESLKTLRELGVRRPPTEVTADPSFAVEPAAKEAAARAIASAGVEPGTSLLGVAPRPWAHQDRWLPEFAEGVRRAAVQLNVRPVFLPMHPAMDRDVAAAASAMMGIPPAVVDCQSPSMAKAAAGQMGLMVGMRLHALIFSASMGVPGVAISYDPKVSTFARAAGMAALDMEALTSGELERAIVESWERRLELGELAGRCAVEMKERALRSADIACELISGKL